MNTSIWPAGAGDTAGLVRAFNWAATPLGPIERWPSRLRTLVDMVLGSPVGMTLIWGDAGILVYNDEYAKACGGKHPGTLGSTLQGAWPEAWDFNSAMFAACRAGRQQVFKGVRLMLERAGTAEEAWFDLYYAPVAGDDGQFAGVLATVIETTSQTLAAIERAEHERQLERLNGELDAQREQLQRANQRLAGDMAFLSGLFQQVPSFMAVLLGPGHEFALANEAYQKLVGRRDLIGKPLQLALPEMTGQGFIGILDQVYSSGEPFYGKNIDVTVDSGPGGGKQRAILDFVYQPLKDTAGRTYGIFVEGIDVTAHAMAEERLRVAQEAGGIGTFEWNPASGELVVSDVYRRVFGISQDTPITAELMVSLVDRAHAHLTGPNRLGQRANPLEYSEFLITRADNGERRWIARRGQAVGLGTSGQPRFLGVVFDITDRKQAEAERNAVEQALRELNESLERKVSTEVAERIRTEEALRQSQKMEAVGQLASGVAHDFNNVLQIISSNLQLMELDGSVGGLLRSRLAHAIAAVERGSRLSSQLLAFARRQPLQPVVTDLGQLLGNIEHLLQRALGDQVRLDLDVAPGLWSTSVDPNQIENAILNMAINSRDAMQGVGWLTIALRNVPAHAAIAGPAVDQVSLSVSDTGCGMPPEVLAKVFDPFYTTKEPGKGTGLGMSMVYGFVKQSGGEIRIDSTPGIGTTITIDLPRTVDAAAALPASCARSIPGGDETILVVEDDPAVRAAAIDIVAGLGYRALKADNGQQALAILQSGMPVDLLFTDVSMPGAVDSAELVAQACAIAPGIAILLTSGRSLDGSFAGSRMPAGIEILPKPYGREQLALTIRQQLGARRQAQAAPAAQPAPGALRLLVVEDDRDARELACEMLAALGHSAHGVSSAEEALELLAAASFDVLFTDLNLPAMSGDELAVRASATAPGLDIILASGDRPVAAGQARLLPKPYDLMQLQLTLVDILGARGRHASLPAGL
ncbi:MAG: response regulator [Massilia sp.]